MSLFDSPDDQQNSDLQSLIANTLLRNYIPTGMLGAPDEEDDSTPRLSMAPGGMISSNAAPSGVHQRTKLDALVNFYHRLSPALMGAGIGAMAAPGPTRGLAAPGFAQQLFTGFGAATQYGAQQKMLQRRQALAEGLLRQRATEAQTRSQAQAETQRLRQEREERLLQTLTQRQPAQSTIQQLHAAAVQKAIGEGRDPSQDPTVLQLEDAITRVQREPAQARTANPTPFAEWRKQHPNDDVSEYFKLAPEARSEFRAPKESQHLTANQKLIANRTYQKSLGEIEKERRAREGGTYFDPHTQELLGPMNADELNQRKQEAEDAYKSDLEAGGEQNVRHYNYSTNSFDDQQTSPSASASGTGQRRVGDIVNYKGKPYRISAITNGKAQLTPAQ